MELRAKVLRAIRHMDAAQRAQLALFLGFDIARDPIDEVGAAGDERSLRAFVESCPNLGERFDAFVRENPGVMERVESRRRGLLIQPLLIAAAALTLAVLPLAAQYTRQRMLVDGTANAIVMPAYHVAAAQVYPQRPRRVHRTLRVRKRYVARHPRAHARPRVAFALRTKHTARRASGRHVPQRRLKQLAFWKFDPHNNPYVYRRAIRPRTAARRAFAPAAAPVRTLDSRARLIVYGYLDALISGNSQLALRHLGMPGTANAALTEASIVNRNTTARVIAVRPQPQGARVDAEIDGPLGDYRETFDVVPDGPALRIAGRFYIPLNGVARRRSMIAAKDAH
jgi:hypothetical protein